MSEVHKTCMYLVETATGCSGSSKIQKPINSKDLAGAFWIFANGSCEHLENHLRQAPESH